MTPTDLSRITAVAATTLTCKLAEVVGVSYDVDSLRVEVRDLAGEARWQITFPGVEGFRVLDEGDLGEFWGHVPGLVIEVTAGGWWEQECSRAGFVGQWTKKVHYHRTKNRQSRSVPIPAELEQLMFKVGMPGTGRLFMSCRAAFRCAYERCGFQTPGQLTHILRHTFASHYMMGGGDILTLQRILGHSSITMTMRYAHLSPEHLESAIRLSPLTQIRFFGV